MAFGPSAFFFAFWGIIVLMLLTAVIYFLADGTGNKRMRVIKKSIITVILIAVSIFPWASSSYLIAYTSYEIFPGLSIDTYWDGTRTNFYILLLVGMLIILAYSALVWKYYSSFRTRRKIAVVMSSLWGIYVLLVAYLLVPIPQYYPGPGKIHSIHSINSLFWGGIISGVIVAAVIISLKPATRSF